MDHFILITTWHHVHYVLVTLDLYQVYRGRTNYIYHLNMVKSFMSHRAWKGIHNYLHNNSLCIACKTRGVEVILTEKQKKLWSDTGGDPGFGLRGGAQLWSAPICQCSTAESHEQSELIKAWGLGPALGPQKLLGFSWLNIHSPSFPGTFWLNFFWFLSV